MDKRTLTTKQRRSRKDERRWTEKRLGSEEWRQGTEKRRL